MDVRGTAACVKLTFCLLLFAVLCVLPQFAAAGPAFGVGLHEELHLHHREALRPIQPEVWAPGLLQRGQFSSDSELLLNEFMALQKVTSLFLV